jgi:hypothetical protein
LRVKKEAVSNSGGFFFKMKRHGQERNAAGGFAIYGKGYIGTGGTNYDGIKLKAFCIQPSAVHHPVI